MFGKFKNDMEGCMISWRIQRLVRTTLKMKAETKTMIPRNDQPEAIWLFLRDKVRQDGNITNTTGFSCQIQRQRYAYFKTPIGSVII